MKKFISVIIIFALIFLSACSVQETVSPQIFISRLQKNNNKFIFEPDCDFTESDKYVCFGSYDNMLNIVFKFLIDEQGSTKKISLACTETDKTDFFIQCVESIIKTYAPDDNSEVVISALFENNAKDDKFSYYDTQWHNYSAVFSEKGLFFSAESYKLVPHSEVEMSLKPNDIVEY